MTPGNTLRACAGALAALILGGSIGSLAALPKVEKTVITLGNVVRIADLHGDGWDVHVELAGATLEAMKEAAWKLIDLAHSWEPEP